MRCSIAIVLFAFAFAGCAESKREAALRVWYSRDATLKQRAHAVSELVPVGTSREGVESILGTNGVWSRFHGTGIDITQTPPRQIPYEEFWRLIYEFPGGGVQLSFDPPTAFGDRFVSASAFTFGMVQPNTALEPTPTAP